MAPPEVDIPSYDALVEDHKQKKWQEVNEIERQKQETQRQLVSLSAELASTQQELSAVRTELAEIIAKRDELKAQWDATVKNVQRSLDAREAQVVAAEQAANERVKASQEAQLVVNQARTVLMESVDKVTVKLQAFRQQIETAITDLVESLKQST